MKLAALFAFALAAGLGSFSQARAEGGTPSHAGPGTFQTRLPNGLSLVVQEDGRAPVVAVHLRYTAGTIAERPNERGLALLTAYMMREATLHVPAGGFDRLLQAAGGVDATAGTNRDYTRFLVTLPSNRLALALWILSDQMGFFAERADAAMLARARATMSNERRQRIENKPAGEVYRFVRDEVFGRASPYSGTFYGDKGALDAVTLPQVIDFYDAHFGPEQATLTVVGDVRREDVESLVEDYFGPIPRGLAPLPKRVAPAVSREVRLDVRAHVAHASVDIGWAVPPTFADGAAELDLLEKVLDGFSTARLPWLLVDERHIATSANANVDHQEGGSLFEITAEAADGHTAAELLAAIDEVLDKLRAEPPSDYATNMATLEVARTKIFGWERPTDRARSLALYAQATGTADQLLWDVGRYTSASGARLQDAAQRYLPKGRRVVALVTPSTDAPLAGVVVGREER